MTKLTTSLRRDRDTNSVKTLRDLLKAVIQNPDEYYEEAALIDALGSQGRLAKFNDPVKGIASMSLNTQKLVAEETLGSYEILDRLRRGAAEAIARRRELDAQPSRSSKEGLRLQVAELEQEITLLQSDLGHLTNAFGRLVAYAHSLARDVGSPETIVRWKKELRSIEAGLSLLDKPMGSNVVMGAFDAKK